MVNSNPAPAKSTLPPEEGKMTSMENATAPLVTGIGDPSVGGKAVVTKMLLESETFNVSILVSQSKSRTLIIEAPPNVLYLKNA